MTSKTDIRNPIELLSEEFLDRRRRGEVVTVNEFADSHPELADKIHRLFPAMIALEQFKAGRASSTHSPLDLQIEPVEQLGDYRIIREIGRGGMGVVYEAEHQSLRRRVAVKVFPGKAFPASRHLDRFHREARTAARLHHTNIVPVFGVGQQDDLHYYVMQRIEGISLDEVIQEDARSATGQNKHRDETLRRVIASASTDAAGGRARTIGQRPRSTVFSGRSGPSRKPHASHEWTDFLDKHDQCEWRAVANVGIQVAAALSHAHDQGVLHRDVKPSNLLLDPNGTVWVTDFGLATVLETEQLTEADDVAGTLRFMAPEHINGKHDPRSDLYSLGLTLYELLTLQPAFADDSRATLVSKILKGAITPPRDIRADIPRDLQAIVIKATAREPDLRYGDAHSFAADLHRFVEGRPVLARRVGPAVRLWRWTKRNPTVASLSAALLLLAVTSFAVIGAKWQESVAANRRAEQNLSLALESMDQILERFASGWMAHPMTSQNGIDDHDSSAIDFQMAVSDHSAAVLKDALRFYDAFAKQNPTNPQLHRDTAKVHRRVADIYQRLGQYGKSEKAYKRSLEFLATGPEKDQAASRYEQARTRNQLGTSLYWTSRFVDAEKEFRTALHLLDDSHRLPRAESQAERARILTNLAQCLALMYRRDEAAESQERAVEILKNLVDADADDTSNRLALAQAYRSHYRLLGNRNDPANGQIFDRQQIREAAITLLEELVDEFPNVPDYRCELSDMLANTGSRTREGDEIAERISEIERGVALAKDLTATHPSISRYRVLLARALTSLAGTHRQKNPHEADRLFNQSINLCRSLTHDFVDIPAYRFFLVRALDDHAKTLHGLGRVSDARQVITEAIAQQEVYVTLRPDNHFGKMVLGHLHRDLSETLAVLDAPEEAAAALRKSESLLGRRGQREENQ